MNGRTPFRYQSCARAPSRNPSASVAMASPGQHPIVHNRLGKKPSPESTSVHERPLEDRRQTPLPTAKRDNPQGVIPFVTMVQYRPTMDNGHLVLRLKCRCPS